MSKSIASGSLSAAAGSSTACSRSSEEVDCILAAAASCIERPPLTSALRGAQALHAEQLCPAAGTADLLLEVKDSTSSDREAAEGSTIAVWKPDTQGASIATIDTTGRRKPLFAMTYCS